MHEKERSFYLSFYGNRIFEESNNHFIAFDKIETKIKICLVNVNNERNPGNNAVYAELEFHKIKAQKSL